MTFLRPERGVRPGGQNRQSARLVEEVRLLRQNTPRDGVAPWQDLTPFLGDYWNAGISFESSYTGDFPLRPRYYVERERVYLDGYVQHDASGTSNTLGSASSVIAASVPIGAVGPGNDQRSSFTLSEDRYYTSATADSPPYAPTYVRTCVLRSDPSVGGFVLQLTETNASGPGGDGVPDGMVFCLSGISWRIGQ